MKITSIKIAHKSIVLACASLLFIFIGNACEEDTSTNDKQTQLVGTWHQTSRTIDGVATSKDSTRLAMQINANSICILCDSSYKAISSKSIITRSSWSFSGSLLNISVDLPASWNATVSDNELSLERVDFNSNGTLAKTILEFERITNIEIE
jgi:hypothetical protein